jgi:hypothetical protein
LQHLQQVEVDVVMGVDVDVVPVTIIKECNECHLVCNNGPVYSSFRVVIFEQMMLSSCNN